MQSMPFTVHSDLKIMFFYLEVYFEVFLLVRFLVIFTLIVELITGELKVISLTFLQLSLVHSDVCFVRSWCLFFVCCFFGGFFFFLLREKNLSLNLQITIFFFILHVFLFFSSLYQIWLLNSFPYCRLPLLIA